METILQDGNVLQTTTISLVDFVAQKQEEIKILQQQMDFLTQKMTAIVDDLSKLVPVLSTETIMV